ncbi:Thioredoxin H-type 2 [Seminavis robusta]|uniref:Thioredoxin H-type 2 n=1 Tax=Seminavis robusta TaxID=568900 RepID=A0A9N8EI98_9STRA|nr:Thioredoxin H-type 2 [Seminavis robusta]|eukprot:Sro1043_g234780.1 Thioredoxin H-type 2 (212) ;mRNA; r:9144-9944
MTSLTKLSQASCLKLLLLSYLLSTIGTVHGWRKQYHSFPRKTRAAATNLCLDQQAPGLSSLLQLRGGEIQYPTSIIHLDDILEETKATGQLVVIYLYSDNCAPCERVAPLFQELAESEEFQDKVLFLKVHVEEHHLIVNQYGVTGWPTFLFLKEGKVQTEIVGGKLAEATLYDWVKLLMPKEETTTQQQESQSQSNDNDNDSAVEEEQKQE